MLLKIDPQGDVLWATATAGPLFLRSVKEAEDGSIVAATSFLGVVTDAIPSMGVAKFSSTGGLIQHVHIERDIEAEWEVDQQLPSSAPAWQPLSHMWSHFDKAVDLELVPGGVVVVANLGLSNDDSAVGAFMLNEEFGGEYGSPHSMVSCATRSTMPMSPRTV